MELEEERKEKEEREEEEKKEEEENKMIWNLSLERVYGMRIPFCGQLFRGDLKKGLAVSSKIAPLSPLSYNSSTRLI